MKVSLICLSAILVLANSASVEGEEDFFPSSSLQQQEQQEEQEEQQIDGTQFAKVIDTIESNLFDEEEEMEDYEDEDYDLDYQYDDLDDDSLIDSLDDEEEEDEEYLSPEELEVLYQQEEDEDQEQQHRKLVASKCNRCIPNSKNARWKCAAGLSCPRRPAGKNPRVLGCTGTPGFRPRVGHSYCIKRKTTTGGVAKKKPMCQKGCNKVADCETGLICRKFLRVKKAIRVPGCPRVQLPIKRRIGVCIRRPTRKPTPAPTTPMPTFDNAKMLNIPRTKQYRRPDGKPCHGANLCHPGSVCDGTSRLCRRRRKNELGFVSSEARFADGYHTGEGHEVLDGTGNLRQCEGDCDSDWDCAWGHVCIERDATQSMTRYGCRGQGAENQDYCVHVDKVKAALPTLVMWRNDGEFKKIGGDGSDYLLGACEGDCDNDAHCRGNLVCYFRDYEDHPSPGIPAFKIVQADAPMKWANNAGKEFGCSSPGGVNDVDYCIPAGWRKTLRLEAIKAARSSQEA